MQSKFIAVAIVAALSLLATSSASAATEVGSRCSANESTGPVTFISLANAPGSPLPATVPSAGVITRWSFSIGLPVGPETNLFETLKVFRPTGASNQFQVIGESSKERAVSGNQSFSTRIPVAAGDTIGALAEVAPSTGSVFCETGNPGDKVGAILGTAPVGSTATVLEEKEGLQNPVVVSVEPDVDNDGYGDETQDACPQSATTQLACPVVKLSGSATAAKKFVTVSLTGTTAAKVTVNGKVSLGKGKKAKLKGGSKTVGPGKLTKFKLKFPAKLIKRLKELPTSKKLTLKVISTAPNVAAVPTKKTIRVKLKGQAPTG